MPKVLTCVHCRKPIHIRSSDVGQQLACPWCSQPFSVRSAAARDALPAVSPADPQAIVSQSQAARRPAARTSRRMMVNRAMLVVTGIWICAIPVTFLWEILQSAALLRQKGDPDLAGVAAVGAVGGTLCLVFFETMIYAATMMVLWVVRENFKE